ncbi:MAG TPA: CDP-archaeol synthase [Candidatus Saccharimonadales bacterium]|jgi:CDP-2,3-bis-(O-geranylgeranyl)-sn-glycerol synthase
MFHDILFAFWFLLPVAAANVAPILSNKIPLVNRWKAPIDGGRTYLGKDLLGPHKTWRGLVAGIIAATLVLWVQQLLIAQGYFTATDGLVKNVDYAGLPTLLLGPLFAIGGLGGDAIESFFKRRRGIQSGGSWLFFDQLDYIVGGILVSLLFVTLQPVLYVWMIAVWFVMHLLGSYVGYLTGFKDKPI